MKYALPLHANPNDMLLVRVDDNFDRAWRNADPEQSKPANLSRSGVADTVSEIQSDPNTIIRLPEIRIDSEQGAVGVTFIDGRHRVAALRKCGHEEVPMLVQSPLDRKLLLSLPFVREVPPEMRKQIIGGDDDDHLKNLRNQDPDIFETIKEWAHQPESIEYMLKSFKERGYGLIADKLIAYVQQHGVMPSVEAIKEMMRNAIKEALEEKMHVPEWTVRTYAPDLYERHPQPHHTPRPSYGGDGRGGMGGP
ncbi:MAG: hypothetical protein ACOYJ2_04040 [Rickettsiales bacterium]